MSDAHGRGSDMIALIDGRLYPLDDRNGSVRRSAPNAATSVPFAFCRMLVPRGTVGTVRTHYLRPYIAVATARCYRTCAKNSAVSHANPGVDSSAPQWHKRRWR